MIYCIVGPTASNKSLLAEKIANFHHAIVINCDAYQVYIEMNKGTAKPSLEFLKDHPNYFLYNFRHIDEPYNVYLYQKDARKLLEKYANENIVVVGGTGLYLKALLYDYKFQEEEAMPEDYLNELTNEELYNCLKQIDYQDALKIGKNNRKRLLRAIYIYNTHNKNKTDLNNEGKNELLYKNVTFIGLNYPREILYERINKRVDEMIAYGLKEEVTKISKDFPKVNQALQAIGYKEFFLGLNEEDTIDLIKKNTRNYAKRQLTFFKNQFDNIIWFDDLEEAFLYAKGIY